VKRAAGGSLSSSVLLAVLLAVKRRCASCRVSCHRALRQREDEKRLAVQKGDHTYVVTHDTLPQRQSKSIELTRLHRCVQCHPPPWSLRAPSTISSSIAVSAADHPHHAGQL
jgi:Fe-S-cluster-containing dehydrogenase component